MLKILMLILIIGLAYRIFNPAQKRISTDENGYEEPDEYTDYEEVKDDEN